MSQSAHEISSIQLSLIRATGVSPTEFFFSLILIKSQFDVFPLLLGGCFAISLTWE